MSAKFPIIVVTRNAELRWNLNFMAYQAIYCDRKTSTVHLWDDTNGYVCFRYKPYAYRKARDGKYLSIYGDKLERIEKFNPRDPKLFESDVPWDTRILIDAYSDSDDVSIGHRMAILDIEVDSTGGYPNIQDPKQKVTAIALYDGVKDIYYCFVLDEDGLVQNETNGNQVILSYTAEEDLLVAFLDKWDEIKPTIATGWNCIPLDSKIYGQNQILEIGTVTKNTRLSDGRVVDRVYPKTKKQVVEMVLSNGHVIRSSEEHVFPIVYGEPDKYTNLATGKNFKFADLAVKDISLENTNFVRIPLHENKNEDVEISDEEIYLAGFIYTDGSLKDANNPSYGYNIYQSDARLLEGLELCTGPIWGNGKKGYGRYVSPDAMRNSHGMIYDNLGKKKLNVSELSKLSTRQFYVFLSGILDGDGCNSNGLSSCDYTESGTDDLYTLCVWNGLFVTKRKNIIRYIDYKPEMLLLRHPSKWKDGLSSSFAARKSKQKCQSILYKKVGGEWFVRIDAIKYTNSVVEMIDIKTSDSYFSYDGVKTHNCDGFDFPYLHARLMRVLGEDMANRLSSINICYWNKYKNKMTIAGVNALDYLLLYKKYSGKSLPNYRLDTVAKEELKIGKVEFEGSLDNLKRTDIKKFIEYNLHDVILVKKMNDSLQFIELAQNICHVCHTGYEEFSVSSKILEGALLTYLRRRKLVAPNKKAIVEVENTDDDSDDDVGFEGAYVKDPIPGRYDWICSADINSLYPSVIMSLNISPETKVGVIKDWDSENLIKKTADKIVFDEELYTYEDFSQLLIDNNLSVSANGVVYEQNKVGCIPDILKKWFAERKEYQGKMRDADKAGDKAGYVFWKRRQQVQKILLNSLYGVLGLPIFRFYDLDNAAAVTLTGQEIIKTSAKYVNSQFNKRCGTKDKDYVVYIDTDSLYLDVASLAKAENIVDVKPFAIKTIGDVADTLNSFYQVMMVRMFNCTDNRIRIAADVVAQSAFWVVKKRYTLLKVYNMELKKDIDEVEVKGLDVVRSSYPKKFRDFMKSVLIDILRGVPNKEVSKKIADFKSKMKDFELEDIAKNTSVRFISNTEAQTNFDPKGRDLFNFVDGSTAQCKAALAYNDMLKRYNLADTEPIMNGGKIKWVYLKENPFGLSGMAFKDDGKDPKVIMDFIHTYIHRTKIWDAELEEKLIDFYAALKWEMYSDAAATIDEFFSF